MRVRCVVLSTDQESYQRFRQTAMVLDERRHLDPALTLLIDARQREAQSLGSSWVGPWQLKPLDQGFNELQQTDAIIDASILKNGDSLAGFYEQYSLTRPVIRQSGTYPAYHSLAPPFEPRLQADAPHQYRQGDCLVSGVVPVLHAFRGDLQHVLMIVAIQKQQRLNDYTLRSNLEEFRIDCRLNAMVERYLRDLMPTTAFRVKTIQVPGHDYYLCDCEMTLRNTIPYDDLIDRLRQQPRLALLFSPMPISTSALQHLIHEQRTENGIPLQPIICFAHRDHLNIDGPQCTLRFAIYSKAITVLPNIDSARALCTRMPMINAMRRTDEYAGFASNVL
ncbi:MAG: glyceraldehyde-3-phosphate dehydrogenase (NAD(P)) [Candidatus Peregrinibacteria bacterium Greene0416_19]|nr:MAG: glyceraldehyde-3-phosphate dehydrogenase (NAD(P)) [Candidatus Peregrinibacteria bacterium Greene0416_19]